MLIPVLAFSPQVTSIINPVAGYRYFPPGLRLLSQPEITHLYPDYIHDLKWNHDTTIITQLDYMAHYVNTQQRHSTIRTLSDNSFSTSFLTRRSMNGLSIICSRLSWSINKRQSW